VLAAGGLQELPEEEYLGEANRLTGAAANFPRRKRDDAEVFDQASPALKSLAGLPKVIGKQVAIAVKEADVVVMVVDGMRCGRSVLGCDGGSCAGTDVTGFLLNAATTNEIYPLHIVGSVRCV